jgi:hypothetical protein
MLNIKIAGALLAIALLFGAYCKLWNTAYQAGIDNCVAKSVIHLAEQDTKNANLLSKVIDERNLSRNKVIQLNEIINDPTPIAPTVTEIIKYKPAVNCKFDDEFKRLLNESWQNGFTRDTRFN